MDAVIPSRSRAVLHTSAGLSVSARLLARAFFLLAAQTEMHVMTAGQSEGVICDMHSYAGQSEVFSACTGGKCMGCVSISRLTRQIRCAS